jgi:hypothetical protein
MTPQTVMSIYKGMAPGLNSNHQIPSAQFTLNTVDKAASYTVLVTDSGTVFTASAAATFTLPAVADATGCYFTFINTADTNMVITAPSGTLVADGNASATSATFSTTSHKIGGCIQVVCNGTKYLMMSVGNTSAVASIS